MAGLCCLGIRGEGGVPGMCNKRSGDLSNVVLLLEGLSLRKYMFIVAGGDWSFSNEGGLVCAYVGPRFSYSAVLAATLSQPNCLALGPVAPRPEPLRPVIPAAAAGGGGTLGGSDDEPTVTQLLLLL